MSFPHLLSPGQLGDLELPNRMLMSPMTRFRVDESGVPFASNAVYYAQRAQAGLIIAEYMYAEPRGRSAACTAGLVTPEQVSGWTKVTEAVHSAGGRIFAQLGHGGRMSHPHLQPDRGLPIAPSAVAMTKRIRLRETVEGIEYGGPVVPRALATKEVREIPALFAAATARAVEAGFDGVELHAGSGFLHHQFLSASTNFRTDVYGGSTANRCRLLVETLEAMIAVRGAGRVGVKVAPNFAYNDMSEEPAEIERLCETIGALLSPLGLAYLHVQYPPWQLFSGTPGVDPVPMMRASYRGTLVAAGEFDRWSGERALAEARADFISYGRRFIANPDLPNRFRLDAPENGWDEATLYAPTEEGFTDYEPLSG